MAECVSDEKSRAALFWSFVPDSVKLTHSSMQYCHSQSVAVLKLGILDVRSS